MLSALHSIDIDVYKLSSLLSDAWLCDEVIDLMLSFVAKKVIISSEVSQSVYVGSTALSCWIVQVTTREPHRRMATQ